MRPIARMAVIALLIPLAGCTDRREAEVDERVEQAAEETGAEMREGARDLRDYTWQERDDFRTAAGDELEDIDREISELGRDTRGAAGTLSEEAMADIRSAREAVDRNLERVGDAAAEDWNDVRAGVEEALRNLRQQIADLRATAGPMGGRAAGQN